MVIRRPGNKVNYGAGHMDNCPRDEVSLHRFV